LLDELTELRAINCGCQKECLQKNVDLEFALQRRAEYRKMEHNQKMAYLFGVIDSTMKPKITTAHDRAPKERSK